MILQINKSRINYKVIGEGKPVIFFSGFSNDMTAMINAFEPIISKQEGWKRIYVDHLSVGDTVIGDDVKSLKDVLENMLKFVDELMGDEQFALAGYSFGSYLSRYVLNNRFDKVSGLLLLAPLIRKEFDHINVDRSVNVIKCIDPNCQQAIDHRIEVELNQAMAKTNREFQQILYGDLYTDKIDLDTFDSSFNKPTLIITGRQDNMVGYKDAFEILDKYPRATYITMDKSGHDTHIEQNDIFKCLVDEWLFRLNEEVAK